ncbi:MAG: hypothetical protein AAGG48_17625 [Planctomycetota bacterium]
MSQNSDSSQHVVGEEQSLEFLERLMQNSLLHRQDGGLSPLHMYGLNAVGLVDEKDLVEPDFPKNLLELLQNDDHADRKSVPDGPFLFIREDGSVSVVEVASLLLHRNDAIRSAARDLLLRSATTRFQTLTPHSIRLIEERSSAIGSTSFAEWRDAGLELLPLLQSDYFSHLAGARQCLVTRYQIGIDDYLERLIKPTFRSLGTLRPPVWTPSEQQELISKHIEKCSSSETLVQALDDYMDFCGYMPLAQKFSAAAVAKKWIENKKPKSMRWDDIESWAKNATNPFAEYHAVQIAINVPALCPKGTCRSFWNMLERVVNVCSTSRKQNTNIVWQLHCELAMHFCRQIEALHPGQRGESIACGAWWLSYTWSLAFSSLADLATRLADQVVRPEAEFSFLRWLVSRSPVVPSSFRHCTLHVSSVWAMSILAQLSNTPRSVDWNKAPKQTTTSLASAFVGYVVGGPLAHPYANEATFAYEENSNVSGLCSLITNEELKNSMERFVEYRRSFDNKEVAIFGDASNDGSTDHERPFVYQLLKDAVFCAQDHDRHIDEWLQDGVRASKTLQELDISDLGLLLDALAEFYQRNQPEWGIRLPHILADAIENSSDAERVEPMFFSVLFMSVNGGIVSPIERVISSKWKPQFVEMLNIWRINAKAISCDLDSWVMGRLRATNVTITRLIGPAFEPKGLRDVKQLASTESNQVESLEAGKPKNTAGEDAELKRSSSKAGGESNIEKKSATKKASKRPTKKKKAANGKRVSRKKTASKKKKPANTKSAKKSRKSVKRTKAAKKRK